MKVVKRLKKNLTPVFSSSLGLVVADSIVLFTVYQRGCYGYIEGIPDLCS